jgi:hypothetical protein
MSVEHQVRAVLYMLTGNAHLPASGPGAPGNFVRAARATGGLQAPGPAAAAPTPGPVAIPDWVTSSCIQAFGLGEKETCGVVGSDIALKVYVEKKLPKARLDKPVPKMLSLGGMDPIITDVVEIGRVRLHGNTQRIRPALPGFSVSRAEDQPNTGTFGTSPRTAARTTSTRPSPSWTTMPPARRSRCSASPPG